LPLAIHAGTAAIDLNASGTQRQDISDVLLASLSNENTTFGITTVGEEFAAPQLFWVEDALNQFKITGDTAASMLSTVATMAVSQSDASVLDIGYILSLDSGVGGSTQEQMQITAISGTTLTLTRAFAGTAQTYTTNSVFRIVNAPTYPNSDLGKDMTRSRLSKTNFIYRFEANINIDSEQILRSMQSYVPGIEDELGYQFQQRLLEMKRKMQQAYLYSVAQSSANPLNEYQTMHGLLAWLNTTANATASPITTPESLTDSVLNTMVLNIFSNGAFSNIIIAGPRAIQKLGQLYTDRIRLDQTDRTRGFFTQEFIPSMANPHRLINEFYLNDGGSTNAGNALCVVADLNRIRIRPYVGQFYFTIIAPTFRDGDAARVLSKWSLEVRNTGLDAGASHQLHTNLTL
jgi:hypothetical protein